MINLNEVEKQVLEFWKKNKIYEKRKEKNSKGKKFYFLQGPPYTSGKLHIGHAWNSSMKDMLLRYKRMKGLNVWDRAGYDMHGLPTENAVQKKLGFKNKEEIEKYGVDKFSEECINFSKEHAQYMNEDLERLGIWMNFDDVYMPITKDFVSGEWALFKKADEQGRLYKGKKSMHWDAESETSLAKHELEYETVKDKSVFLKFRKKDSKDEFFVIWTTTPWTIPFNLGIMVNPNLDYVKVEVDGEKWILAKDLAGIFMSSVLGKKLKILEEFKGKDLDGQEYEHIFYDKLKDKYDKLKEESPRTHTILLSEKYVDTKAGTGLVHTAPGCGPEDQEVGMEYGLATLNTLNERGEFEELGEFNGLKAKIDDKKFIEMFEENGSLVASSIIEHEYPHSWRSHKPVVFRTVDQWFLKTQDLVPKLLEINKDVKWQPKKIETQYVKWTENLRDNSITRQRFWGCPIPIWVNEKNETDYIVIGSAEELEKLTGKKLSDKTIHRPWIDKIVIEKNGKKYRRIEDVADVWYDSGSTSWNSLYNDPKLIKEYFPADFILEATEMTRQWFSFLQICSAIMFNKTAFKNVFTTGMILDFEGKKMSKSLGNIVSPYEVVDKYSADILRYYISQITAGDNANFNWNDVRIKQKNILMLMNIGRYILDLERQKPKTGKAGVEEKWILSKYHSTLDEVSTLFEEYRIDETIGKVESLIISLSRDYIKLVRDKAGENSAVLDTLKEVYKGILQMFATTCPFITEHLWQGLREAKVVEEESVHLCDWPKSNKRKIDKKLEEEFENAFSVIESGLAERDRERIGLRWPLAKADAKTKGEITEELREIVCRQLNIKAINVKVDEKSNISVKLDTKLTPELEEEGFVREISRAVQAERKKKGLKKGEFIDLKVITSNKLKKSIEKHCSYLQERTHSKNIIFIDDKKLKNGVEFKIKDEKVTIELV